jgi:dienelactone hydrolase
VRLDLRDGDLVGTFACPDAGGPFTPVLTLGGSDGGIAELYLNLLVPEGFACLALAYFGTAPLQRSLVEIPIERVERGLRWLAAHPQAATRDGRVGVVGGSKGGELALLAAATYPDLVGPVVAYTPSNVVWAGIDFFNPRNMQASSWSRGGQALPFVPYPAGVTPTTSERGLSVFPIYERGLDNADAVERATIPLERATGPVLLISGGDDRMWPAARMCGMAMERMARHGRADAVRHLNYPEAGHVLVPRLPLASVPQMPMMFDLGGRVGAASAAHDDAWPQVIAYLRQHGHDETG